MKILKFKGKVDAWREKENDDGWNDEAESWGEKTKQTTQTKSDWNKTLEWEEDQPGKYTLNFYK